MIIVSVSVAKAACTYIIRLDLLSTVVGQLQVEIITGSAISDFYQ